MKRLLPLLLFTLLSKPLFAQNEMPNNAHQQTSPVPNGRYEIVVSQWLRRQSFKLDRFTGRVWQKVVDGEGTDQVRLWQRIYVEGQSTVPTGSHPHFQIFLSGHMAADAFLIDNDTGQVWQFVQLTKTDEKGKEVPNGYMWEKINDE